MLEESTRSPQYCAGITLCVILGVCPQYCVSITLCRYTGSVSTILCRNNVMPLYWECAHNIVPEQHYAVILGVCPQYCAGITLFRYSGSGVHNT